VGVYHHVSGIDASSSASLAAYINTLTYQPNDRQHKVTSGLYCCYNAFSRVDMRVQVYIPGTVESYCVDERGNKLEATEEHWLETYLCSVLRAYSYADDGSGDTIKRIIGVRRFNPVTSTEQEQKFMDAAEKLFFSGMERYGTRRNIKADRQQDGNSGLIQRYRFLIWLPIISLLAFSTT